MSAMLDGRKEIGVNHVWQDSQLLAIQANCGKMLPSRLGIAQQQIRPTGGHVPSERAINAQFDGTAAADCAHRAHAQETSRHRGVRIGIRMLGLDNVRAKPAGEQSDFKEAARSGARTVNAHHRHAQFFDWLLPSFTGSEADNLGLCLTFQQGFQDIVKLPFCAPSTQRARDEADAQPSEGAVSSWQMGDGRWAAHGENET